MNVYNTHVLQRSIEGWEDDLRAMQAIGIEWFAVRAVAKGISKPTVSSMCPLGGFLLLFPSNGSHGLNPECFLLVTTCLSPNCVLSPTLLRVCKLRI
jgi:hypothetical protein